MNLLATIPQNPEFYPVFNQFLNPHKKVKNHSCSNSKSVNKLGTTYANILGNVAVSGSVSASSFSGNGASITNLTGANITGVTSAGITDGTIATVDIADSSITSAKIVDGNIVNADISSSAEIQLSKMSTTITTRGSQAITAGGYWVPPSGIYNFQSGMSDIQLQIKVNETVWYGATGVVFKGGMLVCDGVNMRFYNPNPYDASVGWQKF